MSRFRVSVGGPRRAIVLVFAVVTLTTSVAAAAGSRPVLPRTRPMTAAPVAPGPLDPLTVAETNETFQVIESYGQFPRGAFFPYVSLKEPTKRSVLDGTSSRKALAQVYDRKQNRLVEAVVDLAGHSDRVLDAEAGRPAGRLHDGFRRFRPIGSGGPALEEGDGGSRAQAQRRLPRHLVAR